MSGPAPLPTPSPSRARDGPSAGSSLPKAAILDAPPGPSNQPFLGPAPVAKQKSRSNPTDSLMNRMSGPSDQKAGLSRDPDEVKRIIYEASKGSKFFLDQQRRDAELTIKVNALLSRVQARIAERRGDLSMEEMQVDGMIDVLERERVLTETIIVVDADAFYASCHELSQPELKGTAFGVGGGVLTTASYEARSYGCRSAMAGFVAKKLCPHLRFVSPDFKLYVECSKKIFAILEQYGPISPASLDEAYCSVTEYCKREGCSPAECANRIRAQVLAETGLTVSAGVSPNRKLSKIAADFNKPNGQYVIDPTKEAMMAFAHSLPIRKIPGVGRVTERYLQALGVETVADVYRLRGKLMLVKSEVGIEFLLRSYLGLGGTEIAEPGQRNQKGIGVERTFRETTDLGFIHTKLATIAESLADDMAQSEYAGRTLTLKVKWNTFKLISRAKTLGAGIFFSDLPTIRAEARKLFEQALAEEKQRLGGRMPALRLIGLRMSNLRDEKGGRQGGKLDGFVKREPAGAKRARSSERAIKEEHILIDTDDEDDDVKPQLPMFSQEADILDLADSSPPPSPRLDPAIDPATNPANPSPGPAPDPPSSDAALWASFDEPLLSTTPFTHVDRMEQEAFHRSGKLEAMQAVRENSSWGAATQVKRGLEKAAEDRIEQRREEAEREREASGSPRKGGGGGGREAVECPVCGVAFVGSEVALNAHVEGHFGGGGGGGGEGRLPKKKKVAKVVPGVDSGSRTPPKGKGKRDGGASGGGGGGGGGGKATLDGFWKRPHTTSPR